MQTIDVRMLVLSLAGRRRAALELLFVLACVAAIVLQPPALAAELPPGGYFWYAPEHEKYSRTEFFSKPDFRSVQMSIKRTQRFRYVTGQRGWALLEFDDGVRAFIHLRILRTLLHDPGAVDPWYEFQRASVFAEEPTKIEARLKPARPELPTSESKVPVWKRYKEGWSINKGRTGSPSDMNTDPEASASRAPEKKGRNRYPLLPPIGAAPPAEAAGSSEPATEPDPSTPGSR